MRKATESMKGRLRALLSGVNLARRVGERSAARHCVGRNAPRSYALPGRVGAELGHQRIAHGVEIEPIGLDQRRGLDDHLVDVADQLQALVEVLAVKAEPLAEDLHEIDDLEAAPFAGVADLAVAGAINRRQARYPRIGDRGKLALHPLA